MIEFITAFSQLDNDALTFLFFFIAGPVIVGIITIGICAYRWIEAREIYFGKEQEIEKKRLSIEEKTLEQDADWSASSQPKPDKA